MLFLWSYSHRHNVNEESFLFVEFKTIVLFDLFTAIRLSVYTKAIVEVGNLQSAVIFLQIFSEKV